MPHDPSKAAEARRGGKQGGGVGPFNAFREDRPCEFNEYDDVDREMITQMMDVNIDEETLQKVADETGGQYFRATDTESLANIYAEIDQLEKSNVESRHLVDYRELAVEPYRWGPLTVPPILLLSLFCLMAQVLLRNTLFRNATA